jgi:hypothetical protein
MIGTSDLAVTSSRRVPAAATSRMWQGNRAQAPVGEKAANGLAAPAGGTSGTPSPAPSGQQGAAPAHGQAGVAPCGDTSREAWNDH